MSEFRRICIYVYVYLYRMLNIYNHICEYYLAKKEWNTAIFSIVDITREYDVSEISQTKKCYMIFHLYMESNN